MNANLRESSLPTHPAGSGDWAWQALEQHPDAHTLLAPDGKVLWANAASLRILGSSLSAALKQPLDRLKPFYAGRLDLEEPSVPPSHAWRRDQGDVGLFSASIQRLADGNLLLVERDVTDVTRQQDDRERRATRLRQLVEGTPDNILILDAHGTVLLGTSSLAELLGYRAGDLVQRRVMDLVHPDDLPQIRARLESGAVVYSPRRFEDVLARVRTSAGSWRWVSAVIINALRVPSFEAIIVYLRDATRQVELEDELQRHLRRFAALTVHSNDMIAVLDAKGKINFESASIARILGKHGPELSASGLMRLVHPAFRQQVFEAFRKIRSQPGQEQLVETLVRASDGRYHWIEAACVDLRHSPDIAGILITARDITHRKGAELERDTALACGGIALWDYDTGDRNGKWIGPGMPGLYGTKDGRYTEDSYHAAIHPDDLAQVMLANRLLEEGANTFAQVEFRTFDDQGRWRWVLERSQFMGFNPITGARRIAGVCMDITEQRAARDQLASTRDQLRFALESSQIGYYDWDVPADMASGLDDWCDKYGLPREGRAGYNARWDSYIFASDLPEVQCRFRAHLRGETEYADMEYRMRCGSGRLLWVMDRARVVERDAAGNPRRVIGIMIDIHDRKLMEHALLASEARVAMATWGGSFGLWEMDVATQRTTWLSDWCRREDLDPCEEDHVASWDARIHPDDLENAAAAFTAMLDSTTGHFECEYRVRTLSGQWKWVLERSRVFERDAEGRTTKVAGICFNIDSRKKVEEDLRATQRNLQTIAANSPDWMFLLDADGKVRYVNKPVRKLPPEQILGRPLSDLGYANPAGPERADKIMNGVLAGRDVVIEETINIPGGDEPRQHLIRARPVLENGATVGVLVTASDITEQRLRDQLMRLQARVLETIREGVVLLDLQHTVRLTNPAFDAMCGAASQELLGVHVEMLLLVSSSRLRADEPRLEFNVRRLDGSQFAAAAVVTPMEVNGEPHTLVVINDVSERKLLEREILEVSSLEQQRIGNDLHDGLGQELTGVALMLRALGKRVEREYPHAIAEVSEIIALVNHSIESTRALARGLSPVSIERGGLLPALDTLVMRARAAFGVQIHMRRLIHQPLRLDSDAATHVYRIVQEALTNAVRHGRASRIALTIRSAAEYLEVVVRDNGRGIAHRGPPRNGIGLKTMNYRAQMLEGELTIGPARSGGTVVRCRCPQDPRQRRAASDGPDKES